LRPIEEALCTLPAPPAVHRHAVQGNRMNVGVSECLCDGNLSGNSNIVIPAQAGIQVLGAPAGSRPRPGRPGLGKTERTEHHPNDFGVYAVALAFEQGALVPSLLCFILSIPLCGVMAYLVLFGKEQGLDDIWIFFVGYTLMIIVTRPFIGRLFDRQGHAITIIPAVCR
jgi:hypothetical protein